MMKLPCEEPTGHLRKALNDRKHIIDQLSHNIRKADRSEFGNGIRILLP